MSSSNCCFLTSIQVSLEAGQVIWYSHLFQSFPDFLVVHAVKGFGKGLSRVFSNPTVQKHQFFSAHLSSQSNSHISRTHILQHLTYMTTGKTIAFTKRTFVGKVMSLLLNMLSRLVITFLPRSKHLLISWLQSPSAVILEPPQNKVWHCFHCFPIYFPWSDGTRCHHFMGSRNTRNY